MNKDKILELLSPSDQEKIYIPNEIFRDFRNKDIFMSVSNTVFSYSYYCLISYLYRYCKYGQKDIKPDTLKEILGYAANNKTLDKIIKKGGMLDQCGYTETIRNFPIEYHYEELSGVSFTMYSDLDKETQQYLNTAKNFKVKEPVRAFYRTMESISEQIHDGTFFDVSNTHLFNVSVFIDIMGTDKLGVTGFYLYQYLKHKCDLFKEGYAASLDRLRRELGISEDTIGRYMVRLEKAGHIEVYREKYIKDLSIEERKPNTYVVKK